KRSGEDCDGSRTDLENRTWAGAMTYQIVLPALTAHGALRLPSVDIDIYNAEIKDREGFMGDRASKGAFRQIITALRSKLRKTGADPFGDDASEELSKKKLDDILVYGGTEATGIVQGAIEEFSQERVLVIRRFL